VTAIPLAALEAYEVVETYREGAARAEESMLGVADVMATAVGRHLSDATALLSNFAILLPDDIVENPARCRALLAPAPRILRAYSNLFVVDPDGVVRCSALPPDTTRPGWTSVAGTRWFVRARNGYTVPPTPLRPAPVTGEPTSIVARPLRDREGRIIGVLGASLDRRAILSLLDPALRPDGAVVTIFDPEVTVVARSSGHARWAGANLQGVPLDVREVSRGRRITRDRSLDGERRIFATVDLAGLGWKVSAGLPESDVLLAARADATRRVAVFLALLLAGGLLALGLYHQVARSLRFLVERTQAAARGEQVPLPPSSPLEVIEVGKQFNRALRAVSRARSAEVEARRRYQALLEHAVFGILVVDRDGIVREANPAAAEMLGCGEPSSLIGRDLRDFYVEPEEVGPVLELDGIDPMRDVEASWTRTGGEPITVRLAGAAIRYAGEDAVELIVEDISEQKALEMQYRQTQKMEAVGKLAGGIAHDFNNLLTVILAQAQFLLMDLSEGTDAYASAVDVRDAAQRAARLTQQLLGFTRNDESEPQVLDIHQVVTGLDKMLRRVIGEDIELVTEIAANQHHVRADQVQLEQVLMNLVINARDAMPNGGRIVVEAHNAVVSPLDRHQLGIPAGGYVRLVVRDTGQGMDELTRSRIFEPFFTTKDKGSGTGLGLAVVNSIVTQAGGQILVDSAPGRGTTFEILLPQARPDQESAVAPGEERSDEAGGTETVLVVEDEDPVRIVLRRVLERAGYRVLTAADGEEAKIIAQRFDGHIDLLITDMMMPGIKGNELAQWMARSSPETRTLIISGYSESPDLQTWVSGDPSIFLAKPFTPHALLMRVRERLASEPLAYAVGGR